VLNNKGSLLNNMRQYEEAIKVFDKAISINDNKADLYNNKGIALMNLNRNEKALQCFTRATDLDKHFILAFANKAQVEQWLDKDPEALVSLKQAISLLDVPHATMSLNESEVKYIQQSVDKIINPDILATVQNATKKFELIKE
jgi:tetratricopeptide (TPR) repeat protein